MMKEWIGYISLGAFALVALMAILMATDWLWMRGTFCTDGLLQKNNSTESGRLACETVAHVLDLNPGSPIAVCRCKR